MCGCGINFCIRLVRRFKKVKMFFRRATIFIVLVRVFSTGLLYGRGLVSVLD